jgi:hypothetical protein
MPIRQELRQFYGPAHRAYRAALIDVHGAFCSACGRATPRYLNLAHLRRDPRTAVVALFCPQCHGRYDHAWSRALARRTVARRVGQLWLLPEIEWAAAPSAEVPLRVLRAAQWRLF